jgi:hypothetical protein
MLRGVTKTIRSVSESQRMKCIHAGAAYFHWNSETYSLRDCRGHAVHRATGHRSLTIIGSPGAVASQSASQPGIFRLSDVATLRMRCGGRTSWHRPSRWTKHDDWEYTTTRPAGLTCFRYRPGCTVNSALTSKDCSPASGCREYLIEEARGRISAIVNRIRSSVCRLPTWFATPTVCHLRASDAFVN